MTVLYRYETYGFNSSEIGLWLYEFAPIKETPKGWWLSRDGHGWKKDKWVAKQGIKRFAYDTKELALKSFIKRKRKMLEILESNLKQTKAAYDLAIAISENRATDKDRVANPTYTVRLSYGWYD